MAYNKKQRVVGVLVLISVVSILFPVVFDGGGRFQAELDSRIPSEPLIKNLPEPSPVRPVIIADSELSVLNPRTVSEPERLGDSETLQVSATDEAEGDQVEQAPRIGQSKLPEGWSVRLGSFAKQENASNLVERLQASDYKAYTRNISNSAGELISVLVGPWIDKDIAENYLVELEDQFKLAGDIVRYDINSL